MALGMGRLGVSTMKLDGMLADLDSHEGAAPDNSTYSGAALQGRDPAEMMEHFSFFIDRQPSCLDCFIRPRNCVLLAAQGPRSNCE